MQSRLAVSVAQCLGSYFLCVESSTFMVVPSVVQVTGDADEMDRRGLKAEGAIGSDDQEGAAMNMGRSALMAKLLAKTHHDEDVAAVRLFQGAEALFRSQELGYLFRCLWKPRTRPQQRPADGFHARSRGQYAGTTRCKGHPAPGGSH